MSFKYSLIVSQYYHSRYYFIVNCTDDFVEKAKTFATELMAYKRDEAENKYRNPIKENLGDLIYFKDPEIKARYNINDAGDIYFIQGNSINHLFGEMEYYKKYSVMESKGYIKKAIVQAIENHHDVSIISEIVKKHFVLA